ncbi:MAG: hypothetical protein WCR98_07815 [Saccharofermentanales bacterium]
MRIREVIEIVNRMEEDGVISSYAIGGAVGATFYIEPASTMDVDIFIQDKLRLSQFIEEDALDMVFFETLLTKYDLGQKWRLFKQQFGS